MDIAYFDLPSMKVFIFLENKIEKLSIQLTSREVYVLISRLKFQTSGVEDKLKYNVKIPQSSYRNCVRKIFTLQIKTYEKIF